MSFTLGPQGLLKYDAVHRVLICRKCEYAIQKAAISSHLLKHKIYRGYRQQLLDSVAELDLLEPDEVVLPPPHSTPVESLPVLQGYRCTAAGCDALFASMKRIKRHWSEVHGISEAPASASRSSSLQTFFRGTKIKYFEVNSVESLSNRCLEAAISESGEYDTSDEQCYSSHSVAGIQTTPTNINLDMDALDYFYRFITKVSETLPFPIEDPQYWSVFAIQVALSGEWVMCGLLAISATHFVPQSGSHKCLEQSRRFSHRFLLNMQRQLALSTCGRPDLEVAGKLDCVLRCCSWAPGWQMLEWQWLPGRFEFDRFSFISALEGCATFSRVQMWSIKTKSITKCPPEHLTRSIPGIMILLRTLPGKLATILDRPNHIDDVHAVLSGINALIEAICVSFAADNKNEIWMAMILWLDSVSLQFKHLMHIGNPAALILLAYWAILVKRAEKHYWIIRGCAQRLTDDIATRLEDNFDLLSLALDAKSCLTHIQHWPDPQPSSEAH